MSTTLAQQNEKKNWYVIDATDLILGRMAVRVANILRGRYKPIYTPHIDAGDYVIIINADKIRVTGKKEEQKQYMFYTGYRGNEYYKKYSEMPKERVIKKAIKNMLPKNKLAAQILDKLKIYEGSEHPHEAQSPQLITVN